MRAILLRRHGGPSVLEPTERPVPDPRADEVRVRIHAIGINYAEVLSRKGLYGWAPPLPYVPGMEAAGEIEAVGPAAGRRKVGERVIVGAQLGCYAERVCVPELQALPALDAFSVEENAAFAVNYLTAWVALFEMARLRPSDRVLITAAAGGVGTAAVQLAKSFGCTVYGLAGSEEKLAVLRRLGVDQAVNYRAGAFDSRSPALPSGGAVDVVLELVGGDVYRRTTALLAPFGRVVVAGFAGLGAVQKLNPLSWWRVWRDLPRADIQRMAVGSYGVLATHVGYLLKDPARVTRVWRELVEFVITNGIRPVIGATFSFDEIARAHELMESRRSIGKIVIGFRRGPS